MTLTWDEIIAIMDMEMEVLIESITIRFIRRFYPNLCLDIDFTFKKKIARCKRKNSDIDRFAMMAVVLLLPLIYVMMLMAQLFLTNSSNDVNIIVIIMNIVLLFTP